MPLTGFGPLREFAGARCADQPIIVAIAGGDDLTVLEAMRIAGDMGGIQPLLVGPEAAIRSLAESRGIPLDGMVVRHAERADIAAAAVSEVRSGRAQALMKGQIATTELMRAVLDHDRGLRTGRVICQVVLMEIPRDGRCFLLADTGICVQPSLEDRVDIMKSAIDVARALGAPTPKVALVAATELVKPSMPETVEAAEIVRRNKSREIGDCTIEGPLSFDLAYAADAGARKQIQGSVVGAADIMIFPNLLSANLTVKAIMYTADCRFGGILRGTSAPVIFMSRADSTETRLNSLALALRILHHDAGSPGERTSIAP